MEIAATYDRPIAGDIRLQLYGGPVGEPALGPTAFPHRISAMPSPLAPITHHWLDATHITYGVVTGGIYGKRWKAETSVFNGREPDENRTNFDFGALDSWSGRLWLLPTRRWALQVSAGRLNEAEAGHDGGPRITVNRATASATYHHVLRPGSIWASTVGWGRNQEPGNDPKSGHDLAVESQDLFTVAKLEAGYTRHLAAWNGLRPGVGAGVSAGIVPDSLRPVYGSRVNVGFGVFLTLRPAERGM
jgi:hypothetical protein